MVRAAVKIPVGDVQEPVGTGATTTPGDQGKRSVFAGHGFVTLLSVLILLGALGLRLTRIVSSYNLFIDEVTYTEIARNLAGGQGVTEFGVPFALHPPAVLATLALVIKTLGLEGNVDHLCFALRPVSSFFGAATAAICYLVARRTGLNGVFAGVAGLLVAVDPFEISYDSRVMLESETQFFTATTLLFVLSLRRAKTSRSRRLTIGLAGLACGTAFCSKETFGLVLFLTLLLLIWSGRVAPRSQIAAVLVIGITGYILNVVLTVATIGFEPWWHARTSGFSRLIGSHQTTGFNASSTHVSLSSRVAANVSEFGVTYATLLLGGICCLLLIRRHALWRPGFSSGRSGHPADDPAVICAWGVASCGYLVYATLIGSIEEQMYYVTVVPCVLNLVAWGYYRGTRVGGGSLRRVRAFAAAFIVLANLAVWGQVHSTESNMYRRLFAWQSSQIPHGSTVSVTEYVDQFVLQNAIIGDWHTAETLKENGVDYVLINTTLVTQGYGVGDISFLRYLEKYATPVFHASSLRDGRLIVYDVRKLDGKA